ncbi:MAG: tetratricopeptide repeat protein [Kiritimatiellae bacterium]|nr:tetratricopeptide repeat protein [Kiritimatiellia bacterium]
MFKRFCLITLASVALPIAAQLVTAPPQDRLKLAIHLSKRGMHGDALREFEAIRNSKEVPHDEVLFRLGDTYRVLKRTDEALNCYAELISSTPSSRYADVARLNRAMLRAGAERARELKELDRKSAPVAIRSTALNYLGDIARDEGKTSDAIDYYTRAAEISPSNEVGRLANLKCAALLSESKELDDRFRALKTYLALAELDDPALAAESLFSAAMLSYNERWYPSAAKHFRALAERFPNSPRVAESRIFAAWACYLSKFYSEALAIASPLRGPANEDAYYITASSLRMLERRADAIHAYAAQLQAFPKGRYADEAWFDYLTIVAAQGDNAGVLSMLEDRDEPPAKYAERAWGLGCESAITLTNYLVAVRYAKRIVEKNGGSAPNAVHRLAWLLERTQDWGSAARAYRGLASRWPENKLAPQSLFLAGSCEMKRGQVELACNDWKALVAKFPDSPYASDALYARAMAVLRRPDKTAQDYRAAEQLLGERMTRFPNAARRMENLYWWGVAAHGSGDEPEAERHLRAALAEKPSAVYEREIKLELASVLKKRGTALEAAEMLVSLLDTKAVDRITPELLEWTARTMMDAQKWKAALAAADVLERRHVDPAWTQTAATLVGQAHEMLDEKDAAKEAYARALATGSETESGAQAALALGRLESMGGQFDEARAHLENAVTRAQSQEQLSLRIQAYAALAANEEERGAMD